MNPQGLPAEPTQTSETALPSTAPIQEIQPQTQTRVGGHGLDPDTLLPSVEEPRNDYTTISGNPPGASPFNARTGVALPSGMSQSDGDLAPKSKRNDPLASRCTSERQSVFVEKRHKSERQIIKHELDEGTAPTFRQWHAVRGKLRVNADHYDTEDARMAMVWEVTTGLAKRYLTPRYVSDKHGFETAEEMIELLRSYFESGNEVAEARDAFHDLHMGDKGHQNETFPEFKARFLTLAIEGEVSETEWFFYLWNKLTPGLRSATVGFKLHWDNDYQKMVRHLTSIDMERRRNYQLQAPSSSSFSSRSPGTKKSSDKSPIPVRKDTPNSSDTGRRFIPFKRVTTTAVTPAPRANTPGLAYQRKATTPANDIVCYACGEPGHTSRNCPSNAIKEIEGDIEKDMEDAVEEQPEDNLEENGEA